jgi:hypothetical protein
VLIVLTVALGAVSLALNRSASGDREHITTTRTTSVQLGARGAAVLGQRVLRACLVPAPVLPAPQTAVADSDSGVIVQRDPGGVIAQAEACPQRQTDGRRDLTTAQRSRADAAGRRVDQAVSQAIFSPAAPPPDQVAALRQALDRAGYRDIVVRVARPGDPALPGSLLYAVGDGPYCVIGVRVVATGSVSERVDGRLPDGRCLAS